MDKATYNQLLRVNQSKAGDVRDLYLTDITWEHVIVSGSDRQKVNLARDMFKPRTAEAFSLLLNRNDVCKTLTTVNNWFTVFQSGTLGRNTNPLKDAYGSNEEIQIAAIENMSKLIRNMKFVKSPANKGQKKSKMRKEKK